MTYDEVMSAISRGQKGDWLEQGVAWVYKGDLHLRIQEVEEGVARSGTGFSEPWADDLPRNPPSELFTGLITGLTGLWRFTPCS